MSKCISSHGEYSSHENDEFHTCKWCGVFDEGEVLARLKAAEATGQKLFQENYELAQERDEARTKLASVEALLPGPRTLAETLSRDFEGNMWPRTVFEDDLRAALGLT